MKYRLLIVVFLPAIFLIWTIWMDYQAIEKEVKVQEVMQITQVISNVADYVEAISGLSKVHILIKDGAVDKELIDQRNKLDIETLKLKNLAQEYSKNGSVDFKIYLNPVLNKLESIRQFNNQLDSSSIKYNEIDAFFDGILETIVLSLNHLIDQIEGSFSSNALFGIVSLTEEKLYANNERSIIFQALHEDKIDPKHYAELLEVIGMQKAYRKTFLNIVDDQEEQIYLTAMKGESVNDAERIEKNVLDRELTGKYGITPNEWWKNQTEKIQILKSIGEKIVSLNEETLKKNKREHQITLLFRTLIVLATLLISFFLIFFNMRSLARKLQEEINVLSTSGEEIGKSITETASGTSETATAVAETTTTVEELRQTAQVATEKAKNVAEVSEDALKTLKKSESSVEATIQGMNSIQEGMKLISDSIIKLSEHSQMIREIIDSVNDLAEQSHILAVNAAIESAKAGDQGKGFAVVAQEVRSLAEQSKQATVQVRNILNDIQNATSSAVMATEKGSKAVAKGLTQSIETNDSIRSLSLGVNKVAQAASQISLSSQQQLIGVDQLTIAMSNIKIASGQQVNNMNQIEAGIHGLNAVGQSLKQVIHECKM